MPSAWLDFINSEKSKDCFYIFVKQIAEERGGIDKPSGIAIEKSIEKCMDSYGMHEIFKVHNDVLFRLNRYTTIENGEEVQTEPEDYDTTIENEQYLFVEVINSRYESIYDCKDDEDDEEEHFVKNGYFIVSKRYDFCSGDLLGRDFAYVSSIKKAISIFNGESSETDIVDLFQIKDGEAKLLFTTSAIKHQSDIDTIGFTQYDSAINPYNKCGFKCTYCYAEIKDLTVIPTNKIVNRVAVGTHIDPYGPQEATQFATKNALLSLINNNDITKVGIFTKSPLIVRDIDIIKQLKDPVVHFCLSPYPECFRLKIEKNTPANEERIKAIKTLVNNNIRVIINLCPIIPTISDDIINSPIFHEAYSIVDEICIGLICLYGKIPDKIKKISEEAYNKLKTRDWETPFMAKCREIFKNYNKCLVIWRDRTRLGWKDLRNNNNLPQEYYQK